MCLGTLWGLGKNAPMTIRPTFTTKLFSGAMLYSTDISPSPWLGSSLQGAVHFPPREQGRCVGFSTAPHPTISKCSPSTPFLVRDKGHGLSYIKCRINLAYVPSPNRLTPTPQTRESRSHQRQGLKFFGDTVKQPAIIFTVRERGTCPQGQEALSHSAPTKA